VNPISGVAPEVAGCDSFSAFSEIQSSWSKAGKVSLGFPGTKGSLKSSSGIQTIRFVGSPLSKIYQRFI
jgi:hypothetical protein